MISMNEYTVEAPVRTFSGESVGVQFAKGTGRVNDSTKEGRAAIEYFRRQGYALTRDGDEAPQDDPQEPDGSGLSELFDPAKHDAPEVLAYLDSLVNADTQDTVEFGRVIAAERDGKARKTILARGEHKQEAGQ